MKKAFVCLILLALLGGWLLQGPLVTAWGHFNRALHDTGQAQVVAGRNGWLYFREALDSTLGARCMSDADMDALAQALSDIQHCWHEAGHGALCCWWHRIRPWYIRSTCPGTSTHMRHRTATARGC